MIDWMHHPEPDTKNPSDTRKYPESFFWYSPPMIDRLELICPHQEVGDEIDDTEIDEH